MFNKQQMVAVGDALPGRASAMALPDRHFVLGTPLDAVPDGHAEAYFAMGCFWGAERKFWQLEGVYSTAVGYMAGYTPNPTYREVCSGQTGHTEAVKVVFDPAQVTYAKLLAVFWENHDPTQGMRQGNDVGTQYRSGIYTCSEEQNDAACGSLQRYGEQLAAAGHGAITTEIRPAQAFYYAEPEHQQYLGKNPAGYCGLGGTGVACPIGLLSEER
jgi:peptide-methionine (S)-S-oxide reductase